MLKNPRPLGDPAGPVPCRRPGHRRAGHRRRARPRGAARRAGGLPSAQGRRLPVAGPVRHGARRGHRPRGRLAAVGGEGHPADRGGCRARRRRGHGPAGPAGRAGRLVRHRVRRPVRRPHLVRAPRRQHGPGDPRWRTARGAQLRAGLDRAARPGCLELRHRRVPRRAPGRAPQVHDPHLARQVRRGPGRGPGGHHGRDLPDAGRPRAGAGSAASCWGRSWAWLRRWAISRNR